MIDRPPSGKHKNARSGEHATVCTYRAKIDSVDARAGGAVSELDRKLQEFLTDLKTPVPSEPPTPTPDD